MPCFLLRMVKPSWLLRSSCVRAPTLNVEVITMVLMESVTWTALQKMATALTLWTQLGRTGEVPQSCMECSSLLFFLIYIVIYLTRSLHWSFTLAKSPALHLHPSSLGKSSLRTMVSQRMWSSLPAVLAQKKTHEQMASPTWDPHFHPGGYLNIVRTRTERKFPHAHQEGTQGRNVNKPFPSQCWAHSSKDAPPL